MDIDQEHIRQLYLQKLTDSLSEKEEEELAEAMHDPRVRKICRELDELYSSPEMRELLRVKPTSSRWDELMEHAIRKAEEPAPYRGMGKWLVAASVLILAGVLTYHFGFRQSRSSGEGQALAEKDAIGNYDIRLKLYSGDEVALTGPRSRQTVLVGDVQLNNDNRVLRYQQREAGVGRWNRLEVPAKMDYKVVLSDGTEVWLNASSSLRFPFSFLNNVREVEIRGEAYFRVTKDAARPFVVKTPGGEVSVLGTSFNVNTYGPDKVVTSLVEGSVKAVSGGREVLLQPGQEAVLEIAGGEMTVQEFDHRKALSWMEGICYFENAAMPEIAGVLDRWYDVKVVYDNPAIAGYKFDVKLNKARPLSEFLEVLKLAKGVNYRLAGNTLHLN